MKKDDLERLEELQEIQQLIRCMKKQYEQEKVEHTPPPFSFVMQTVRKEQCYKKRLRISPWWLTAACLLGWILGYGFSGGSEPQPDSKLAVTDTVIVVHERVDTIYREVKTQSPEFLIASQNALKPVSSKKPVTQSDKATKQTMPAIVIPDFLQQEMSMPDPESDCYAANGMTVAEDNYPIHLLMTAQSE
ncbi:hypothetical protein [Bacteroides sp.]|uniref:hypothetical protein n=1 Tax=Bacteroides sp. TaxID=29523 RepID=UPI00261F2515|nr:hypothetical protein [Bacteroides sp.]MDD3036475.1 hypothetical protein [Bacteroides sp.]